LKKVVVLGGGLIGGVIARDLAAQSGFEVIVVDGNPAALERLAPPLRRKEADLSSPAQIRAATREADAVVGALPGFLGRRMLEAVLAEGKSVCDISFSPEDPLELDAAARSAGATAVVDCGVSPGLSNFAVGRAASRLDEVDEAVIFVGGLPAERRPPFEYALLFSATDVIEEYTRPARVVEQGRVVARPALSEIENVEVEGVGTLEAFLTDGLRTLLRTVPARRMKEKTLRYPGHAERMRTLRDAGFFDERPIEIGGARVSPRAVTERLLARLWKLSEKEEEFTYLRVVVSGQREGVFLQHTFELLDRTDPATGTTSMARATAFPCAIVAGMLARGEYRNPGVCGLETLALDPAAAERLIQELRARGLNWKEKAEEISPEAGVSALRSP